MLAFLLDRRRRAGTSLLGWVCQEVRAGKHDLAFMLEKDPAGWNAALLATPAFFGSRNRIPGVALLETRIFNHRMPKEPCRPSQFLAKYGLSPLPEAILPVFRLAGLILAAGTARGVSWLP